MSFGFAYKQTVQTGHSNSKYIPDIVTLKTNTDLNLI